MNTTTGAARVAAALLALAAGAAHAASETQKGFLSLTVQGRAFTPAGPLVNANVTGFGGVASAPVTTNATGDFTVTINFDSTTSLARLVVRGVGAQSHVELKSIPGPHSALALVAGDTILDRTEDPYVDLTPHTTGVYLAMRAIDPLVGDAGWQRARRSFVAEDAIRRTTIVGTLADGIVSLPAGTQTTLEAASTLANAQDVQDRLFGPNGGACLSTPICDAVASYRSPAGVPVLAAPVLDQELRAYFPFRHDAEDLSALTLSTGGTGGVVTPQQRTAIVWAAIGDYLRVHRADDAPMQSFTASTAPPCAGEPVRTIIDVVAFRVRHLAAPGGGVLMQYGQETRSSYPDTPACTDTNQVFDPDNYVRVVSASAVPLPIADPTGKTIVLPICETACADPPVISTTLLNRAEEPHRFDAAGVGAQLRIGRTFTWALVGGRLQINYANGHSANVTQVSDEVPGIGTAITRYVDGTGVHQLAAGTIAEKDPAASFGADMDAAAGVYDSQINREYPFATIGSQSFLRVPFGFTLNRDGTGSRFDGAAFVRWSLEAPDRLVHDRFANATSSTVQQRRFWEVIRANGNDLLVLESFIPGAPFPTVAQPTARLFVYVKGTTAEPGSAPEVAEPLATPGDAGDSAGAAVASGGEFVVIGAPNAAVGGTDGGAVYVYRKPVPTTPVAGKEASGHWTMKDLSLVATLTAPAPTLGDKWGASVTIAADGSSIAIGAPGAATTGQVAVFAMPGGGWTNGLTPTQVLTPPAIPGTTVQNFGAAIAMTPGGTLAVGAPGSDVGAMSDAGLASIYTPNGGGFNAPQQITPGSPQPGAAFGSALAASDSLLAIGAPSQDDANGNRDSGAVHTYRAPSAGAAFNFNSTLQLPGADSIGNKFGAGVAVTGDTLLVGAPFADTSRGHDSGGGYIYEGTEDSLPSTPTTQLVPQGIEGDGAGVSVGMIDGLVVLGAPTATRDGFLKTGAAFVFRRPGLAWSHNGLLVSERELGPGESQTNQQFGAAIALARDFVVAGSPNRDRGANADQGEADAFAFDRIFGSTFD